MTTWLKSAKQRISTILAGLTTGPGPSLHHPGYRVDLPESTHQEVGRPRPRANNPYLVGVAYILRLDQWAPYFVATGGALNLQTLFGLKPGDSYTPSGGAAQTITAWHTTMRQSNLLSNPNTLNVLYMSLAIRGDVYAGDLNRFLFDTLMTFQIGDATAYAVTHAYRVPAGGGAYGASSAYATNGFPQELNQYEMWYTMVNGRPTTEDGGTGEIFPGSGVDGKLGELITQTQQFSVQMQPTLVADANGNGTYTTSASGVGITSFVILRGQLARAVQG